MMSRYRVYHVSEIRGKFIVGVEIEGETGGDGGQELTVEGRPGTILRIIGGRIVFDGNDISNRRILIVERPEFPLQELLGKSLVYRNK